MGIKYKHLTEQDRIFLRIMLDKGYAKTKIAKLLKVNLSPIYREVKSNSFIHRMSGERIYWNYIAQEKYLKRRKKSLKLEQDVEV